MHISRENATFNRFTVSTEFAPGANDATLSDLLVLTPTTKTIWIVAAYICAVQTGAGHPVFRLIRRLSADVGGTPAQVLPTPWDTAAPTSWTKADAYSAHPTSVGTSGGAFRTTPVEFGQGGAHSGIQEWPTQFSGGQKYITIRPGQFLAINAAGLDAAATFQCSIHFDEEE